MSATPADSMTAAPTATTIVPSAMLTKGLLLNLIDGITPEKFARMPQGVVANHPAFILGHVALYSTKFLAALGVQDAPVLSDELTALFSMDAACQDDPDGSIYPPMNEIVELFKDAMNAVIEKLPQIDQQTLDTPPENDPFGGVMTTMGATANFIFVAHPMMHAGQLSTWRRCMGLGPCKLR